MRQVALQRPPSVPALHPLRPRRHVRRRRWRQRRQRRRFQRRRLPRNRRRRWIQRRRRRDGVGAPMGRGGERVPPLLPSSPLRTTPYPALPIPRPLFGSHRKSYSAKAVYPPCCPPPPKTLERHGEPERLRLSLRPALPLPFIPRSHPCTHPFSRYESRSLRPPVTSLMWNPTQGTSPPPCTQPHRL